ncbi:hypothetical protein C0J52_26428 [Blattella germanica]|nr:hypothetical protein C0J52_26428 [Blattella germanica]
MIYDITYGSLTTSSWTRVSTFVSYTSSVPWTICTEDTFRSTSCIGITLILCSCRFAYVV